MGEIEKYNAVSIPKREAEPEAGSIADAWKSLAKAVLEPTGKFAEIEYDHSSGSTSAGETGSRPFKLIPASQLIGKRAPDPIREKFHEMRSFAPIGAFVRDDAWLFYRQAKFMEDFTDDFQDDEPFSMYYPYYQHMSYGQLRTYFSWRAKVREGVVRRASLSYVFLYIYELLSGIGAENPADGLDKLTALWKEYREAEPALDKYLPRWLRDYHIYYDLPHSFTDFIDRHDLRGYYPELFLRVDDHGGCLLLWNGLSGYDITKSKFYNDANEALLNDCFHAVLRGVRELCAKNGSRLEDLLIYRVSKGRPWRPFEGALFHNWLKQPDRQTELPDGEMFYCKANRWTADIAIYFSGRREFTAYLIKKTEACLRQAVSYKYTIKAERNMLPNDVRRKLVESGLSFSILKKTIEKTVAEFHAGLRPTVKVEVDYLNLTRIRDEALGTQSKLIVPEEDTPLMPAVPPAEREASSLLAQQSEPAASDGWASLRGALSETEREALRLALQGGADIMAFAAENGVMPEVLADGINEKAMDHIGDNILELDGDMILYDDYRDKVTEMVEPE